nr:MAG TPA: hypothetical protein [Caudoviricetes sp.]
MNEFKPLGWFYSGNSYTLNPYEHVTINLYTNLANNEVAYTLETSKHESKIIRYKFWKLRHVKIVKLLNGFYQSMKMLKVN